VLLTIFFVLFCSLFFVAVCQRGHGKLSPMVF